MRFCFNMLLALTLSSLSSKSDNFEEYNNGIQNYDDSAVTSNTYKQMVLESNVGCNGVRCWRCQWPCNRGFCCNNGFSQCCLRNGRCRCCRR